MLRRQRARGVKLGNVLESHRVRWTETISRPAIE
jgi:hypothetical protein